MLSKDQKEGLFIGIYVGMYNVWSLPVFLYEDIRKTLTDALHKSFKPEAKSASPVAQLTPEELLGSFEDNIAWFSAAKTFQQVKDMQALVLDETGAVKAFNTFRDEVEKVYGTYNESWLRTEQNTVVREGQMAEKWLGIEEEKNIFPFLQYSTVGDALVRPEHAALDGIVKPVDDPFWNKYYPPNDWNCRCTVLQMTLDEAEGKAQRVTNVTQQELDEIPLGFRFNAAKTGYIFKLEGWGKHPYMKVGKEFEEYAQQNFNLPL